jgi:hypothetical protein
MQPGESFTISIPGHDTQFVLVYDRTDSTSPQFAPTWVGHLKGNDDYRTLITTSGDHSVGRIKTPEGNFQIETSDGLTTLTDVKRAGMIVPSLGNDALVAPHARSAAAAKAARSRADLPVNDAGTANSVIDVLVLYNASFATATGNPQNVIANLIAVANQAMIDSTVLITFRIVATQSLAMSDADSEQTLLDKVTYYSSPKDPNLIQDPLYAGVPALRDQYGADLVVAIRPFNQPVQLYCGIAWINVDLNSDSGIASSAPYAYAVVSYGQYNVPNSPNNEYYICDQATMAHEMGHNLGLAHDRNDSKDVNGNLFYGVFPYSFGYGLAENQQLGVPGFATIMAANYIPAPVVDKYSSPNLACNTYTCGVTQADSANSADNVSALKQTGPRVAQFRATTVVSAITPETGYWWNPAEPGRGYNIEKNSTNNNLFMAAFLYDITGRTTWYGVGPGAMVGNTFTGTLETYSGGQTLTGTYKSPTSGPSAGNFSITFTSPTQASLIWPGGTVPIQRYEFVTGGLSTTNPTGTPQTGWWWAPSQGGRGFAIEIQKGSMFLAGYMYDGNGNPVWYASGPTPMIGLSTYSGTWEQFGNGQTLTGAYQPAAIVNSSVGLVNISFSSTTSGLMTFPNSSQVLIQRFPF